MAGVPEGVPPKKTAVPQIGGALEQVERLLASNPALHNRLMSKINAMCGAVPRMSELPAEMLLELAAAASTHKYKDGVDIVKEGAIGDSMFFVIKGTAQETRDSEVLSVQGVGAFFGEANLLSKSHKNRMLAIGQTECLRLKRADVEQMSGAGQEALQQILKEVIAAKYTRAHMGQRQRLQSIQTALDAEVSSSPTTEDAMIQKMMLEALSFRGSSEPEPEQDERPTSPLAPPVPVPEKLGVEDRVETEIRAMFLDSVPLLSAMTRHELWRLADVMVSESYEDEPIIEKGDQGDSMFVLKEGCAEAVVDGVGVVCSYTAGDYFGELALLSGGRRAATVNAVGSVICLVRRLSQPSTPIASTAAGP